MSVYQRKSDMLWIVAWYESKKKKTRAFKDEQTARAFEHERLSRLGGGPDRITVGELTALFFRSRQGFHPVTRDTIVWLLSGREDKEGKHLEAPGEFLRDKYAEALTRHDLERMREGFRSRSSGNNTINKYQAYINAILSWGVEQQLLNRNPWRDFKRLSVQRKPPMTTTLEDVRKVYLAAPSWLQWAIKTMYALTIRPGQIELFGLRWSAFDWTRGAVIVQQGKSGSIKTVFPPAQYLAEARERFSADSQSGVNFVCSRDGRRIFSCRTAWALAIQRAGLQHFPMYHIRHVAVSIPLSRGADLASVAAQAGHSAISTTSNFYAHVIADGQQRAAALMPGIDDDE